MFFVFFNKHQTENMLNTQWWGKKKTLLCNLVRKTAYFITVLCKIFMQIFNLFFYHENAGVMWIFVKVLNRTVFTVIMLTVTCRNIWKIWVVIKLYMTEVLTDSPIYTYWMQYFYPCVWQWSVRLCQSCQTCIQCNANCYRSNNSVVKDTTV